MALGSIHRQSFALEFQKVLVPEVLSSKLSHPVADMHVKGALQILTDFVHTLILLFSAFLQLPALNMFLDLDTFLSPAHFTAISMQPQLLTLILFFPIRFKVMSILEICGTNQGPNLPHSKMLLWS